MKSMMQRQFLEDFDGVLHACGFAQCMTEIGVGQNTRTEETAIKQFTVSFVGPRHI